MIYVGFFVSVVRESPIPSLLFKMKEWFIVEFRYAVFLRVELFYQLRVEHVT